MSAWTAPRHGPSSGISSGSRYESAWTTVALVTAAAWIAIAVLETPRLALLGVAVGLGAIGGILFVRAPGSSPRGRRQYVSGVLLVAGLVLVMVGVAHHLEAGLVTVALLAGSSPSVLRWVTRS